MFSFLKSRKKNLLYVLRIKILVCRLMFRNTLSVAVLWLMCCCRKEVMAASLLTPQPGAGNFPNCVSGSPYVVVLSKTSCEYLLQVTALFLYHVNKSLIQFLAFRNLRHRPALLSILQIFRKHHSLPRPNLPCNEMQLINGPLPQFRRAGLVLTRRV